MSPKMTVLTYLSLWHRPLSFHTTGSISLQPTNWQSSQSQVFLVLLWQHPSSNTKFCSQGNKWCCLNKFTLWSWEGVFLTHTASAVSFTATWSNCLRHLAPCDSIWTHSPADHTISKEVELKGHILIHQRLSSEVSQVIAAFMARGYSWALKDSVKPPL